MLKLGRVTKVKVLLVLLAYSIKVFEFSSTILEKGLLKRLNFGVSITFTIISLMIDKTCIVSL